MLIRSEKYGVRGGAAHVAPALPAASMPTLLLAGFCFLSAPEGRLGGLRLGTQGLRENTKTPSALM